MRSSVLFVTNTKSLQPDEVRHLIHSEKHPILIDLNIGTECTQQLLVQFFLFIFKVCLFVDGLVLQNEEE